MNACGTCTLCCKILGIVDDDGKSIAAPGKWCPHANNDKGSSSRGCTIYDSRPSNCLVFNCVWLTSQGVGQPMPLYLRPDRCNFILIEKAEPEILSGAFVIKNNAGHPFAHDRPSLWVIVRELTNMGRAVFLQKTGIGKITPLNKQAADLLPRLEEMEREQR